MRRLLLLLAACLPARGAITFVQAQPTTSGGNQCAPFSMVGSVNCTLAATPTVGHSLLVFVASGGGPSNAVTVTDNQSPPNTYTELASSVDGSTTRYAKWFIATVTTASGTFTVQEATAGGIYWISVHVMEYSGLNQSAGTGPKDASGACGSITTTNASDLIVGGDNNASGNAMSVAAPFTLRSQVGNSTGEDGATAEYIVSATQSGLSVSFTGQAGAEACTLVAIKQASAATAKVRHRATQW